MNRIGVLLVLVLLAFPRPAAAQQDVMPLFGSVQPARVMVASAVLGTGYNQREYLGQAAQDVATIVKGYSGQFTAQDHIQPFTWNFETWQPVDYTPLVLMVSVREEWQAWDNNWRGVLVLIDYMHRNTLSCYDVGDPVVYECRQYQGSVFYEMSYHVNSVCVTRQDVMLLAEELGL